MTQQPPPGQSGGYYQSQYSQQPSYPEQPQYPQQPSYPQQPQQPSYPQQPQSPYPQQQSPYPQQQSPYPPQYPQDPPPSSPYPQGQQPGYDYQAPSGYQQPGYYPGGATPTPPAKSGRGRLIGILGGVGGAAVLAVGGIAAANFLGDSEIESQTPEVGECITEASLTAVETEVVDCTAPEAAWLVLGNAGEYSENEFDTATEEQLCGSWETTGYILWIGEITSDGEGNGQVVCLEQVTAE